MKRFMKKVVAAAAAATLVLSMSLCAFAAPSPNSDIRQNVGAAKDQYGNDVNIAVDNPTQEERPDENTIKEVAGDDFSSVGSVKIDIPNGFTGSVDVEFAVPGGVAGETYTFLVPDGNGLKVVTLTADANGKVQIPMTEAGVVTVLSKAEPKPDPTPDDPTKPVVNPTKPSTGGTTTSGTTTTASKTVNSSSTSPKTGESSMVVLASALAVAATAGACVLARRKRA